MLRRPSIIVFAIRLLVEPFLYHREIPDAPIGLKASSVYFAGFMLTARFADFPKMLKPTLTSGAVIKGYFVEIVVWMLKDLDDSFKAARARVNENISYLKVSVLSVTKRGYYKRVVRKHLSGSAGAAYDFDVRLVGKHLLLESCLGDKVVGALSEPLEFKVFLPQSLDEIVVIDDARLAVEEHPGFVKVGVVMLLCFFLGNGSHKLELFQISLLKGKSENYLL